MRVLFHLIAAALAGGGLRAAEPPLIPRDALFGNPDRVYVKLSPDGKYLSWVAPTEGVLNVWVGPAESPEAARPITRDRGRGVRSYTWAYDNAHVLYVQDRDGDENYHVFAADVRTGAVRDLTPFEAIVGADGRPAAGPDGRPLRPAAYIADTSDAAPGEVLLSINNRDPRFHDLYRVNVADGEMTLVQKNDGFAEILTDAEFRPRLALTYNAAGGVDTLRLEGGKWKPFDSVPMEDALTTNVIGFDRSGGTLYMTDSRGRNTAALVAVDMVTGLRRTLVEDARADAGMPLLHPRDRTVQAAVINYTRVEWVVVDPAIQPDMDYLRTVAEGDVVVLSRSLDDARWVVAIAADNGPRRFYLYDRAARKASYLFSHRRGLEGLTLAKMYPVVITARDGMQLVSYLTLPAGSSGGLAGAGPISAARPLPMVLLVHGGPWARDDWGLNLEHQWLANRGYAVLSVNYRGSTGFGKAFVNAGAREWGGKMQEDLVDAARWASLRGIADPARVAIYGTSYGGFAALSGLASTPEEFACGVSVVGPSSLITFMQNLPAYWITFRPMLMTRVGDPSTEEGRKFLESRSPLNAADRIKRPLLIGQGANDPRVRQGESDQIVKAMQARKVPVSYVLFGDEGHGFIRPQNRRAFYAVAEAFLSRHLGGRYEEIGDDFEGSSITVPAGAGELPGVEGALKK